MLSFIGPPPPPWCPPINVEFGIITSSVIIVMVGPEKAISAVGMYTGDKAITAEPPPTNITIPNPAKYDTATGMKIGFPTHTTIPAPCETIPPKPKNE
jgi:hypothetical protein